MVMLSSMFFAVWFAICFGYVLETDWPNGTESEENGSGEMAATTELLVRLRRLTDADV
jgi:hypothetical protein